MLLSTEYSSRPKGCPSSAKASAGRQEHSRKHFSHGLALQQQSRSAPMKTTTRQQEA